MTVPRKVEMPDTDWAQVVASIEQTIREFSGLAALRPVGKTIEDLERIRLTICEQAGFRR